MRTVRLVSENEHSRLVRNLDNALKVRADAVVSRVVYENRLCRWMRGYRLLDVGYAHAERNAEATVDAGVDVDRHRAADDERVDGASMDIARQDDLVADGAGRHYHRLHRRSGAVHHEKRVVRAERLGRELLRLLDDGNRMPEVVERFHGVDVHGESTLAKVFRQLRIAAPALVRGHVEVRKPVYALAVESVRQRRLALANAQFVDLPPGRCPCHLPTT